jgi:MFS family permease
MTNATDLPDRIARRAPWHALATLCFALLAMSVSMSFVFAVLPPVGRDLGLTELQLGLIVSPAALVFVLANGVWGVLSERVGRKPVIVIAVASATLVTVAFGGIIEARLDGSISVMATFLLLASSRITLGALAGGMLPAAQAYIADTTSSDSRTTALAVIGVGFALGMVIGPGVGAATSSLGVTAPFYIVGALAGVATLVVHFALAEPKHETHSMHRRTGATSFKRLWALLTILVFCFMAYGILLQVTGFRMQDEFALSTSAATRKAGLALMIAASGLVVTQIAVARSNLSAQRSGRVLLIGTIIMMLGMGALGHVGSFVQQLAAMTVIGVGMGMILPATLGLLTVIAEAAGDQGKIGGWSGAAQGLGLVFGPLAGSVGYQLGQAVPYRIGFLLLLVVVLLAAVEVPKTLAAENGAGRRG